MEDEDWGGYGVMICSSMTEKRVLIAHGGQLAVFDFSSSPSAAAIPGTNSLSSARLSPMPRLQLTAGSLTAAMIGGALVVPPRERALPDGPVLVQCDALEVKAESGTGLRHASFAIRGGELVAVAGVEGNGQRELLRAVAGLRRPFRGLLEVARPIAFVPEDRTTEGLVPANVTIQPQKPKVDPFKKSRESQPAATQTEAAPPSPSTPIGIDPTFH